MAKRAKPGKTSSGAKKTSSATSAAKKRALRTVSKSVKKTTPIKRKVTQPDSFPPTLGDVDLHLFGEGRHERIYDKLGAHLITQEGVNGVSFAVWAPNAQRVSVVGDFNSWDGTANRMRPLGSSGAWET